MLSGYFWYSSLFLFSLLLSPYYLTIFSVMFGSLSFFFCIFIMLYYRLLVSGYHEVHRYVVYFNLMISKVQSCSFYVLCQHWYSKSANQAGIVDHLLCLVLHKLQKGWCLCPFLNALENIKTIWNHGINIHKTIAYE